MLQTIAVALLLPLLVPQFGWFSRKNYFVPTVTLSGVGVSRENMTEALLARRTELMIESQTFAIMRDPQALAGAQRILSPNLQKIFKAAEQSSGVPASFIAAVAYLESWGDPKAQSPTGPKGIMQIAQGTAKSMGLKVTYAKRYRVVTERKRVRLKSGKYVTRAVSRKVPYTVVAGDERLIPQRAVPAAARYLKYLENKFGGRDWAVFAYHCGEGCTSQVKAIVNRARLGESPSVAQAFFAAHPARHRELYDSMAYHMQRDFSPTYWFRIMRAEQLLELYRTDPAAWKKLYAQYRNRINPVQRAPHRLTVWLTPDDFTYQTCEDLRKEQGRSLVQAFDDPKFFGFTLAPTIGDQDPANKQYYMQASPAALGTITYIAYETRRLHDAMKTRDKFVPLEITSLVMPRDAEELIANPKDGVSHCSGQVFDISGGNMSASQREALEFVLNDLGWDGYLGFVRESGRNSTYHVGAAPTAREFFTRVYQDAIKQIAESD